MNKFTPVSYLFFLLSLLFATNSAAQSCSALVAPTFSRPNPCFNEYFTSITASGNMGTTSSISITPGCTTGGYTDLSATQGIDAPVGADVVLNVTRFTTNYTSYVSVYIDWNNNNIFETHEHAGWPTAPNRDIQLGPTDMTVTSYHISPPCGAPAGNFHMRVMLSEALLNLNAPCIATYGQAYDFYYNYYCPSSNVFVGDSILCRFDTAVLTAGYGCGLWHSSDYSLIFVDSNGSIASNGATGSATIAYNSFACGLSSITVSVVPTPFTIPPLCIGGAITVNSWPSTGTWTIPSPSVTSISPSSGICDVSGLIAGNSPLTYTVGACSWSGDIHVNNSISIIGDSAICLGTTTTLSIPSSSGTWTSSNEAIATVNSSGVVTGVSGGTFTITYETAGGGCIGYKSMAIIAPAITGGGSTMCSSSTMSLTGSSGTAGTWSSSNSSIAYIGSTGIITTGTGSLGITTISYQLSGCLATRTITVNASPPSFGMAVCENAVVDLGLPSSATYSNTEGWLANIDADGILTITSCCYWTVVTRTYTSTGCSSAVTVTVNMTPDITGSSTITCGSPVTLSMFPGGGTWSSSNSSTASVNSSGIVTGGTPGTATISYILGTCVGTKIVTVQATNITGSAFVCEGKTVDLDANFSGGTWSSANSSIATVSDGTIYGNSSGVTTISYNGGVCTASKTVTVGATPNLSATSSNTAICLASPVIPVILNANISGGSWTNSGSTSLSFVSTDSRSVSSPGSIVTSGWVIYTVAHSGGSCFIKYDIPITLPPSIPLPSSICETGDDPILLPIEARSWSTSNSVANINLSGYLSSNNAGSTVVTCMLDNGCSSSVTLTVKPSPRLMLHCGPGGTHLPVGFGTTVFGRPKDNHFYASSNPSVMSVTSNGYVNYQTCYGPPYWVHANVPHGESAGTAKLFYVSAITGCKASMEFTFGP